MILRRHWVLAAVAAIGLHAVGLSVFAQQSDIGADLPDQQGIEVELGMLGEHADTPKITDEDSQPYTTVTKPSRTEPEIITRSEPAPEPEPPPEPKQVQKADVQIKPESKPKPKPVAQAFSNVASNEPEDVEASPARASHVPRDASRLGGKGPTDKNEATAAGARTSWYAQVVSHLAQHKHYPMRARRMRHEAVVTLSFVVTRDGSVRQAEITGPSKHRALNKAVQDMLERAKPLPVFPEDLPEEEISLSIPVAFKLR